MIKRTLLFALLGLFLCAASAKAITFEELFGATNIYGHVGNSSVAAAFSKRGEMTVFHWPSPSYFEHLNYLASNAENARDLPYFGALPQMGSFAGIAIDDGNGYQMHWLRDDQFQTEVTYQGNTSNVLKIEYLAIPLGLSVIHTAFVHPEKDILVQRFLVEANDKSKDKKYRLIFYENFSPSSKYFPVYPIWNWALDFLHDFAALYDPDTGAVLHYQEHDTPLADLSQFMTASPSQVNSAANNYLAGLYNKNPPGIYLAMGFGEKPDQVQVGFDSADTCGAVNDLARNIPFEAMDLPDLEWLVSLVDICWIDTNNRMPMRLGWNHDPQDAFNDAQDGVLSGSHGAGAEVNAALAKNLVFDEKGVAAVDLFICPAYAPNDGMEAFLSARAAGYETLFEQTQDYWNKRLARAWLPDTDDQVVMDFALRTLITIFNGSDKNTGAIVASIATQSPYYLDWPRDAAFINHALDLAGYYDEVTMHNLFFAAVQRKEALENGAIPAGTWEMNYFADGAIGGFIRFEIDNTGCITWSLWDHYLFLKDYSPVEAMKYLNEVYPAISLAADGLAGCVDEATGLQCLANEDDNVEKTISIQGAASTYMALVSAVAAGIEIGENPEKTEQWAERAEELRLAAMEHFWNEENNHFDGPYSGRTWALWPGRLLEPGSDFANGQAAQIEQGLVELLNWEKDQSAYDGKGFLSLAHYYRETDNSEGLARVQEYIKEFIHHVPMEGTLHMGEVYAFVDNDDDGVKESVVHKVSQPHIWEASLNFAASMVAFGTVPPPPLPDDDDSFDDDDQSDDDDDDDDNSGTNEADDDSDQGCCG